MMVMIMIVMMMCGTWVCTGVYPECELCGECYESAATRIDNLGSDISQSYVRVIDVWSAYYS